MKLLFNKFDVVRDVIGIQIMWIMTRGYSYNLSILMGPGATNSRGYPEVHPSESRHIVRAQETLGEPDWEEWQWGSQASGDWEDSPCWPLREAALLSKASVSGGIYWNSKKHTPKEGPLAFSLPPVFNLILLWDKPKGQGFLFLKQAPRKQNPCQNLRAKTYSLLWFPQLFL